MPESLRLPEQNRSSEFYADFTIKETMHEIVVTEGWIFAPHRGDEMMNIIQSSLQTLALERNKTVVHLYEASTLEGKKLVQRNSRYSYLERSHAGYSVYKAVYEP